MTLRESNEPRIHQQVASQVTGVAMMLIGVKLLSAFKEIILARAYGVGALMDAYQFVVQLTGWIPSIFVAVCSAALVPAYISLRDRPDGQFDRFRAQVHGVSLILSTLLALGWLVLGFNTPLIAEWSGLSAPAMKHASEMILPMALMLGASMYIGLLTTEGIASRLQGITLLEATPALVLIVVLLPAGTPGGTLLISATVGGTLMLQMFYCLDTSRAEPVFPTPRYTWITLNGNWCWVRWLH